MEVILHSVFLWPIQAGVGGLFLFLNEVLHHHVGFAVVLLSLVVNLMVLPLYLVADRWQLEERLLRESFAPRAARIRKVFRGDERQMLLATLHRQAGYRPWHSLRASVGLLIQIPFFLAAYEVLSHADGLRVGVWLLQDLSQPDRLLRWGALTVNVLPLVMTALNLVSAVVYVGGFRWRNLWQPFLLAGLFLVLLYNSPAGLVLYWTVSNLFSLGKNLVLSTRRPGRVFHRLAVAGVAFLWAGVALVNRDATPITWGLALAVMAATAGFPFLWRQLRAALEAPTPETQVHERRLFWAAAACLFCLSGLAVPALFLGSSTEPLPDALGQWGRTVLQTASLFLLLPAVFRAMASRSVGRLMTWGLGAVALTSLAAAFVVPPTVSFNASFTATDPGGLSGPASGGLTAGLGLSAAVLVGLAVRGRRQAWVAAGLAVSAASMVVVAAVAGAGLASPRADQSRETTAVPAPLLPLTQTGRNQIVIFIDGFPAPLVGPVLDRDAGLKAGFDGFVWHPNTVSFGYNTFLTTPALMGGTDFTPEAINARVGIPLGQKHDEAQRVLPRLLSRAGERVTLVDHAYISYDGRTGSELMAGIPGVTSLDLRGHYTDHYFSEHPLPRNEAAFLSFDYDVLARFSLFRMAAPALREPLYRNANWWIATPGPHLSRYVTDGYPILSYLPDLTKVDEGSDSAVFLFTEVFHDGGAFDSAGLLHAGSVEVGNRDLAAYGDVYSARSVYDGLAVLRAVNRWFGWLKAHDLYDRSRIVLVADHGHPLNGRAFGPQAAVRPLLMVKDYGAKGPLRQEDSLMTIASMPSLVSQGLPGAIPSPDLKAPLRIYQGPNHPSQPPSDRFVFTGGLELTGTDARRAESWKSLAAGGGGTR